MVYFLIAFQIVPTQLVIVLVMVPELEISTSMTHYPQALIKVRSCLFARYIQSFAMYVHW